MEYDSNRDPLIVVIYSLINDMDLDLSISKDNEATTIIDKLKKLMSYFKFGATIIDEKQVCLMVQKFSILRQISLIY